MTGIHKFTVLNVTCDGVPCIEILNDSPPGHTYFSSPPSTLQTLSPILLTFLGIIIFFVIFLCAFRMAESLFPIQNNQHQINTISRRLSLASPEFERVRVASVRNSSSTETIETIINIDAVDDSFYTFQNIAIPSAPSFITADQTYESQSEVNDDLPPPYNNPPQYTTLFPV